MNINYLTPLLVVIICNVCYHLISKSISGTTNTFIALFITYGVACLISAFGFLVTSKNYFITEVTKVNVSNVLLGLVVVGIEGGYILMYRSGWEISKGSLIVNMCVAIILLIVGILVFRDGITIKKIIGVALCIIGIFFINK
ncbi:drug/metabolite transporter (DMT)-like permease [Clostridium saccharoperbutylacetonicum]|uniref:EamA-like transporter family n=1 Tax=Clostridium saccharoperbutylacetonicum N1-4(HMT) TaxID=931276 RepID=M1LV03_9CLOT|nr:transporter [Clostridium saccharoperbutylacetonicum]AGF56925.1 EamA-like transporter family [Clostridium saccharoperbutylacetonicum N1-4(HMT)]NRT62316.1 drug/metabolite transporter (DMT)-like permease [Clostridium saccharoperbutylacetonicum]NSB25653.1 drug/metabolite transporter (DMT)-like permease [Clostridium saccharoperbutylacetonicum]NSB45019.1 drug/metabolite transporter (DMT)-like permease [Clostridium saccharoperbutylacetonicum]